MTDFESDFIPVTRNRRNKKQIIKKEIRDVPYEELVDVVFTKLNLYKSAIVGAFIYGSRARGTNRPDSDADIIVFWRHEYDQDFLKSVRASIEDTLGFKIDFVSCVVTKKWIDHHLQNDQAYFENVIIDAKPIIGSDSIIYLIDHSRKLSKLHR